MPNPKNVVRYDELSQLLVDNGFRKDGQSYLGELWVNNNNKEFVYAPAEIFIHFDIVEVVLRKANISLSQLEFYKIKYFKSEDNSE